MKNRVSLASLGALIAVSISGGCAVGFGAYTAKLRGQSVRTTAPLVARRVARKLVIVVDAQRLPDAFQITNIRHSVTGFRPFMQDSLKNTLSSYFDNIVFVEKGAAMPSEPHLVAELQMNGVEGYNHVAGRLTYTILKMQWAFAVRPSEAEEYLFSFAGVAASQPSYRTLDEGCQQMMQSAMHGLLSSWTKKKVHGQLRALDQQPTMPTKVPVNT
ncbi:MAG: hypothetical protein H6707_19050 [Deltaproteobacteria bacterium]|nr:hypothetical protein [Deltaproteobacteria bacterium]